MKWSELELYMASVFGRKFSVTNSYPASICIYIYVIKVNENYFISTTAIIILRMISLLCYMIRYKQLR
jgi:hypothetical protein